MSSLGGSHAGQESWWWEEVHSNRTGVSGDFAKEFKNETVKEPGMFAADHIPAEASLLVREAIQNSWDAARERYVAEAHEAGGGGRSRSRFDFGSQNSSALSAPRSARCWASTIWPIGLPQCATSPPRTHAGIWA